MRNGECFDVVDGTAVDARSEDKGSYGCVSDADCCNTAAKCGTDRMCRLPCWQVSDPSMDTDTRGDNDDASSKWINTGQGQLILLLCISIVLFIAASIGVCCLSSSETQTKQAAREVARDRAWLKVPLIVYL